MEDLEKERDLYKANLIKIFKLQMDHTQEMWEMLNTIFDRRHGDQGGNEPLPFRYVAPNKPRNEDWESVLKILEEIKTGSSFPRVLENAIEAIREEIDND